MTAEHTILVVEDEIKIAEVLKSYLEREGFSVATAADGEEALRLYSALSPALVLLDLMLPKISGEEVCRTIRARGDDLTVQRVELDAPVLDVPALQRWLATRPPGETRIPTLRDGLHVVRGRIVNDDWSVDGIEVALPSLSPTTPVAMRCPTSRTR